MTKYVQTEEELLGHLLIQIAFLERSSSWYDNGFEEEAIRLAIAVRILVHDTNNSHSILSQLGKKDISFYDSAIKYEPNAFQTPCLTSTRMTAGRGAGAEYKAPLDDRRMEKIGFGQWWEGNVIFRDEAGNEFTRKELVRNVTDTDGGAHVDPKLKEAYANLSRFNLTGLRLYLNGKQSNFKNTPVLPSIRQIAHEVLKTLRDEFPDLFKQLRRRFLMPQAKIGVIGGTGLYDIEGLTDIKQVDITTPFGRPSDTITIGTLEGQRVAFLPRHGKGHRIMPTEIPQRANIYALKSLGVEHIIAINSVGSFKLEVRPGDLLIPDQLIDRTRQRVGTFFGDGIVAHIQFAEPFCPALRKVLYQSAKEAGARVHSGGTYVVMEGPAFSTGAESRLHRSWGADVIGMTALPEAKLAREAEICYAIIACSTDYDSWHETEEPVSVEAILGTMRRNMDMAKKIIKLAVSGIPQERDCDCATALMGAIVTAPELIALEQKKKLDLLLGKYLTRGD